MQKIVLNVHISKHLDDAHHNFVTLDTARKAVSIWRYFSWHMSNFLTHPRQVVADEFVGKVFECVKKSKKGMTPADIKRIYQARTESAIVAAAEQLVAEKKLVAVVTRKGTNRYSVPKSH